MITYFMKCITEYYWLITINFTASGRRCRVLFSYAPANEDELALQVDDEIDILAEVEEGWWRGKLGDTVSIEHQFIKCPVSFHKFLIHSSDIFILISNLHWLFSSVLSFLGKHNWKLYEVSSFNSQISYSLFIFILTSNSHWLFSSFIHLFISSLDHIHNIGQVKIYGKATKEK